MATMIGCSQKRAAAMSKKRNRIRPLLSFQERLNNFAQAARAAAKKLPPSAERSDLLQKARDGEAAAKIDRWLSSPGSQNPNENPSDDLDASKRDEIG